MKKRTKPKAKRYTLALSESDMRRLTLYAGATGAERPAALARLCKQALRDAVAALPQSTRVAENQLGLFDAVQIDIFDQRHKVINQQPEKK